MGAIKHARWSFSQVARPLIQRPRLLMCLYDQFRPATADGHAPANQNEREGAEIYNQDPEGFKIRALGKQRTLREEFYPNADTLDVAVAEEAGPDQVFTADGTFTLVIEGHHYTVVSKFTNEKRQAEVNAQIETIKKSDAERGIARTFIQAPYNFEGTGDAVYDVFRDVVWAGYDPNGPSVDTASHGRSDIRAHHTLEQALGVEFVSLPTQEPGYHIDTVIAPLSKGHMLVNMDAITPEALKILKYKAFERFGMNPDEYLIPVTGEDAKNYATNLRCFGDRIVMPECSQELRQTIEDAGYDVTMVDLKEFLAGGGSGHCLSNNIDEERIIGGIAKILGIKDMGAKVLKFPAPAMGGGQSTTDPRRISASPHSAP